MKNIFSKFYLFSAAMILMACIAEEPGLGEEKDKAKIIFVNVAPNGSPSPDHALREIAIYPYYNGFQFNNHPIKFSWSNGYKAFDPGTMNMRLDTAQSQGNDPPKAAATVKEISFPTIADGYYSVYAVGTVGPGAQTMETIVLEDNLSLPSPGKVKIRLMNYSPNAGPVDIVTNTGQVWASNIGFKDLISFFEVNPGTYSIQVRNSQTGEVLLSRGNIILDAASCYSIWLQGFANPLPAPNTFGGYRLGVRYHANRWTNPLK